MPIVQDTHARLQCCMQEISLEPLSSPFGYARGVIVLQCDSHIILASLQVSLKWPARRGHLAVL